MQLLVVAAIIFKFYCKFHCMLYCTCDRCFTGTFSQFAIVINSRFAVGISLVGPPNGSPTATNVVVVLVIVGVLVVIGFSKY